MASLTTGAGAGTSVSLHDRRAPPLARPTPLRTGAARTNSDGTTKASFSSGARRLSSPKLLRPGEARPLSPGMRRGAAGSPPIVTSPSYNIEELKSFEALCKTAYYEADTLATKLVEQTIRNQSMAGRGAFIKAQSAVRVAYHRDMEVKRRRELEQALAEMDPGSVVRRELGGATTVLAMRSARARHERRTRLARFLSNHALRSLPGPHPFLRSLHAGLQLQSMPVIQSGAGKRLVEWDIDDAVLLESGKDFLRDAVELLKGVLGMDETLRELSASYVDESDSDSETDEPLSPPPLSPAFTGPPPSRLDALSRARSGSDPFTDPPSPADPATPSIDGTTPPITAPLLSTTSSFTKPRGHSNPMPPPRTRTFTLPPYLTDPELQELASLFPPWITTKARGTSAKALEEGSAGGHGSLRIGQRPRDEGWTGTMLERFVAWLRTLFR